MSTKTDCVHRWAHNEDKDKTGVTGHMRFHGNALYSYATIIAVKHPKQKTVVFAGDGIFNSPTTCNHKGNAKRALPPGWKTVEVDVASRCGGDLLKIRDIRKCHDGMLADLREKLKRSMLPTRAPSRAKLFREYQAHRERCDRVAEFLGRRPFREPAELDAGFREKCVEAERKRVAAELRRDLKRRKEAEKLWAERIEKERQNAALWRSHKYAGNALYFEGTYIRLTEGGGSVETSRHVVVELADALRLFRMAQCCRSHKAAWSAVNLHESPRVGPYRVVSVDAEGNAVVGCHRLTFDEMQMCFGEALSKGLVEEEEKTEEAKEL